MNCIYWVLQRSRVPEMKFLFCPFRCGFMHQDRDILKIGHLADACMTNFPSLLPCSDVCPQAGMYLSFVHAFFGHQPIRNALLQEAPRPNCRFPWWRRTPTHQLRRERYHPSPPPQLISCVGWTIVDILKKAVSWVFKP